MKYVVMECHLSYAVVLDENGRFLKAANLHYEVGQTITDIVEMQSPDSQGHSVRKTKHKWVYSLAAIAACILIMVIPFQMWQMPYASVYMSINPEVRIDVNRKDTVIGLEGVNADGQILIENYNYKKKNLEIVMDELVDRAIETGFLHQGGQITLTLDAEDGQWAADKGEMLSIHLNEYVRQKLSVTIEVKDTSSKKHEVVIPIVPDSTASDTTYRDSDYGEEAAAPAVPAAVPGSSDYHDSSYDDGQTDYGGTENDGLSGYDETEDDGQSRYRASEDDGQTDYGNAGDDGPGNNGNSGYNHVSGSSGDSGYDHATGDGGDSGYEQSPGNSGNSGYNHATGDSGNSGYDHATGNGGDSGYDSKDDNGQSGYGDDD